MTPDRAADAPLHESLVDPLARPPGVILIGIAVAVFGWTVVVGSEWTAGWDAQLLVLAAWGFLGLAWLFRFAAGTGARTILARWTVRWAALPVLFIVAAVLVMGEYPRQARFALSRDALDAIADRAAAGESIGRGWVGLYPVEAVTVDGASVRLAVSGQLAFVRDAPANTGDTADTWFMEVEGRWSVEEDWQAD